MATEAELIAERDDYKRRCELTARELRLMADMHREWIDGVGKRSSMWAAGFAQGLEGLADELEREPGREEVPPD